MTRKLTPTERINLEAEAADRSPPWPTPLPHWFWPWAAWRDAGGVPKERPNTVPQRIPAWAWDRYKLHRGAKRHPAPSAFGGKGLFTGWDPTVILRQRPAVDWIAVTLDPFNGVPGCTATMAQRIRNDYRTFAWEARATYGYAAVTELGASGYIGQAESETELGKTLAQAFPPGTPKALVGKPDAWHDGAVAEVRARGWELLYELYWNVHRFTPDSKGFPVSSWVFGAYDAKAEGGGRVLVRDYLAELPTGDFAPYLAEGLDDDDWQLIGRKP